MAIRRKALKGAVKRGLLHKDAVDGPVPVGGPRRWTCLTCGREFRRNGELQPRLFGCGCCSAAWDMFGLRRNVAAGKPALLIGSGVVGTFKTIKRGMAIFIAEGGDAEEIECEEKALAPIYQHKTEHEQPCRHSPMPSGIAFKGRIKETPMAVRKFTPKGKVPGVGEDVAARLTHIFSTSGGTTAAQAVAQVADLGVSAESSVERFLADPPPKGYALQQRKGEGGAVVYRLAQEQSGAGPGGTQQEEGTGMATKVGEKKAVSKKVVASKATGKKADIVAKPKVTKAVKKKKVGVIATMRSLLATKAYSKKELVDALSKVFPDRPSTGMAITFSANFAGSNPLEQRTKGNKVIQTKKDGVIYYELKLKS